MNSDTAHQPAATSTATLANMREGDVDFTMRPSLGAAHDTTMAAE
jgi:hypothetical protein